MGVSQPGKLSDEDSSLSILNLSCKYCTLTPASTSHSALPSTFLCFIAVTQIKLRLQWTEGSWICTVKMSKNHCSLCKMNFAENYIKDAANRTFSRCIPKTKVWFFWHCGSHHLSASSWFGLNIFPTFQNFKTQYEFPCTNFVFLLQIHFPSHLTGIVFPPR